MDSSSLAHCRWECQYHIVFIPKYRKKRLYGVVRDDVREIIRTLCKYKKVEIIAGAVCADHVHLCVSIPPKLSISDFVGYLKGKSALVVYDKHPDMESKWDSSFWARGYYVTTGYSTPRKPRIRRFTGLAVSWRRNIHCSLRARKRLGFLLPILILTISVL